MDCLRCDKNNDWQNGPVIVNQVWIPIQWSFLGGLVGSSSSPCMMGSIEWILESLMLTRVYGLTFPSTVRRLFVIAGFACPSETFSCVILMNLEAPPFWGMRLSLGWCRDGCSLRPGCDSVAELACSDGSNWCKQSWDWANGPIYIPS